MNDPSISENQKNTLRKQALALRAQLPNEAISGAICQHLAQWPVFKAANQVLFYHPFRHEVDLLPLARQFPEKRWYLPAVMSHNHLEFFQYHPEHPLKHGKYGIQEPPATAEPLGSPEAGAILLTPGLMFDQQGYRLGYGKGYFDKFLNTLAQSGQLLIRVGIVPQALVQKRLPVDAWDMPMHFMVTESGILTIDNPSKPD